MSTEPYKITTARFAEKWKALEHVYEAYAKSRGLTYMSFTVLGIIYDNPDCCTQKLICEHSLYTKQSVNAIVKSFWEQGYVKLIEEKNDRRNKRVVFTENGSKYADEIIGRFSIVEKQAMAHLSDKQWELLIEMADTFEKHFVAGINELIKETGE